MIPRLTNNKQIRLSWLVLCGALAFCCSTDTPASVKPASARCVTCHLPEYNAVTHPPHAGVRPTTCGTCHTEEGWHPFRLQHSWALDGAHAKVDCFKCHNGFGANSLPSLKFEGTPKECIACHKSDKERANSRVRSHSNFPDTCEKCHSTNAWKPTLPHNAPQQPVTLAPLSPSPSAAATAHKAPTPRAPTARKTTPSTPAKPVVINPTPSPTQTPTRKPDVTSGASKVR